ncbi:hypothetical protein TNCV_299701 [Trichonephila clavipes]|nr:hypothetical protein TNCV_299701 [Trichonephila clavipes]
MGSLVVRALDSRPKAWVQCPMPPNTLRVHTEYVLVKSVGLKVLWAVKAQTTCARGWRIFTSLPDLCLNCEGGFAIYRIEVQPVPGTRFMWKNGMETLQKWVLIRNTSIHNCNALVESTSHADK